MENKTTTPLKVALTGGLGVSTYCCFNCDALGGGMYKEHKGATKWFIGLEGSGEASYACDECKELLFDFHPVTHNAEGSGASASARPPG